MRRSLPTCELLGFVPELVLRRLKSTGAHDLCPGGLQAKALENRTRGGGRGNELNLLIFSPFYAT